MFDCGRVRNFLLAIVGLLGTGTIARCENLYVLSYQGEQVSVVGPGGSPITPFATGIPDPAAIAVDSHGNAYVAEFSAGRVIKIDAGTGTTSIYATGFTTPSALAFDSHGDLFIASQNDDKVYEVGPGGGVATSFSTGYNAPEGIAVDAQGNVYVSNLGSLASIGKVGPAGGVATTFAFAVNNFSPTGLAIDPAGNLFISNGTTVDKVGPQGGFLTAQNIFASGFKDAIDVAIDSAGNLYVDDLGSGGGIIGGSHSGIYEVGPGGGASKVYATGFSAPIGIAFPVAAVAPEPSSLVMLGTAIVVGGAAYRRRRG